MPTLIAPTAPSRAAPAGPAASRPLVPWAIAGVSAWLAWRGWVALGGAAAHAVTSQGMVLIGPAVLGLVAAALVAERRWPAVPRPLGARGHRQDAAYLGVYVLVAVPFVTLVGTGFAETVLARLHWTASHALGSWPLWCRVLLAVVLTDLCNWTAHLLNHRVGGFWRYHALHHSQEEMSILTSFRAHPLVHASFQVAVLPILLLGTAGRIPVAVLVGYVVLSTLPHANVAWDYGPLRRVIVNPAYHRLHHDRDNVRGANLGTVLILWDVLAGLAVFPERGAPPVETGIAGRPVPVEQAAGAGGCVSTLLIQLTEPFRRSVQ